jgi:hypothetical protein
MEGTEVINEQPAPKAPRKPRPSEIAAKKAKAAKKKKPAKKAKSKAKRKPAKKAMKKPAKRKAKKVKASKTGGVVRCERVDMRVSKVEKARIVAKAKKLRRTVTSVVLEAIEKIK